MSDQFHEPKARRPLREVVSDIDRDILRLLMRRHNLLRKMHNAKGFLDPSEEKGLREAWEAAVSRVSRDARLSSRFFSLMQEVDFLPRPEDGEERRAAFNLAPPALPVRLDMEAPLACRASRAWLFLAAASGHPLTLGPCLMNDPIVDCVKLFNQMGAALNREDASVVAAAATPMTAPDKVLHAGDSAWNFYLALAFYLGRPSRTKFTGDTSLKLGDFSPVRRLMPSLGARLVHVVPKSDGFPIRIECSGALPDSLRFPAEAPIELAEALLLAGSFYERPLRIDLADHPHKDILRRRTLPILRAVNAKLEEDGDAFRISPSDISLPQHPLPPMEPELALFLLALAPALGGEVRLRGRWPDYPGAQAGLALLGACGATVDCRDDAVVCSAAAPLKTLPAQALSALGDDFPADWLPLPIALAAAAALRDGDAALPVIRDSQLRADAQGFLMDLGLDALDGKARTRTLPADNGGNGEEGEERRVDRHPWNAPTPVWAMALAVAACAHGARTGFKLGNPGIITGLYPAFWALYNGLPEPRMQRPAEKTAPAAPKRRRVITNAIAVLPEPRDEDY
ncbi:3-phosphoshikimate 1-carboxyvinyltransferase [uncultured Desulfovibrio sp.]|uniref:3-phosphoshikimate 1-carboxyvinyltransferase n=1 Tax=uncultured Desulfovibrio sp. TaxID=167968 RepID=UPI0026057FEA|nr:3-phosphoshikimate 1-carboxyvinyltransferase [uncultured Desulfovibrio sp.]